MAEALFPAHIRAVLLDIEGTTTPADFVYSTLFAFARARLEQFLHANCERADTRADLEALGREYAAEPPAADLPPWREDSAETRTRSGVAYVLWLMQRDRKSTALKSLQGKIWEAGYRSGELRGEVYPDVPPAFVRWRTQQRNIAIFSSGSVLAQKLLFGHSTAGDLTPYISAYFDTTTGPKKEEHSYRQIAAALGLPPADVLFCSDAAAELDAAGRAGLHTALCIRFHAVPPDNVSHSIIRTFNEVFP